VTLQTCAPENLVHVDGGPSGGPIVRSPGSEDPYRREWKFLRNQPMHFWWCNVVQCFHGVSFFWWEDIFGGGHLQCV
jgi:hypothetical protein